MNRIKAAGRAAGRFLKVHGECFSWVVVCVLILGWVQVNDAENNAKYAADLATSIYMTKK